MDSTHCSAAASARHGGNVTANRRRKQTRQSRLPISCVDSSLQARVVMEQISRERGQMYQQSVVQTVLGQHEGHRNPSGAKSKLKFPNIGEKNQQASVRRHSAGVDELGDLTRPEAVPCNSNSAMASYLDPLPVPHATRRPGGSNRILHNAVPSCRSGSSSTGGAGKSHHQAQHRPRAAVHKNGVVLRAQPTTDHSPNDASSRHEYVINPGRRREVRRRYTPDTVLPGRARSQSSGREMTNPAVSQTRKRRGSNLEAVQSQSDQDIPTVEARHKTRPNLQPKTRHVSKSQDDLHQPMDSRLDPGPSRTGLGPSDWQLAREKSFEITFPGYDTRFVDLPDPNTRNEQEGLSDTDRQIIESQMYASSVEKCRRWLNKWVLTT